MIQLFLTILLLYLIVGFVFAVAFALVGYEKIDSAAHAARWRLRLLWMPGAVAVWPVLAVKWKNSNRESEGL